MLFLAPLGSAGGIRSPIRIKTKGRSIEGIDAAMTHPTEAAGAGKVGAARQVSPRFITSSPVFVHVCLDCPEKRSCSMAATHARVSDKVGQPTRRRIAEADPRRYSCPPSRQEPLGLSPQWGRFRNLRLLLRRGAQYRGGRVAHHHCDRADRHRQSNGRDASLLPKCGSATRSA